MEKVQLSSQTFTVISKIIGALEKVEQNRLYKIALVMSFAQKREWSKIPPNMLNIYTNLIKTLKKISFILLYKVLKTGVPIHLTPLFCK